MRFSIFTFIFTLMAAATVHAQCPDAATLRTWENEAEKCAIIHGKTRDACNPTMSQPLLIAQQNMMRAGAQITQPDGSAPQACGGYSVAAGGLGRALSGFIHTCSHSRRVCIKTCGDVLAKLEKSLIECTQTAKHEELEDVRNRVRPPGLECKSYETIVTASNSQLEQMRPALEQAKNCVKGTSATAVAASIDQQAPAKSVAPELPKAPVIVAKPAPVKAVVRQVPQPKQLARDNDPLPVVHPAVVANPKDFDPKPKTEIHNEDEEAPVKQPLKADVYEPMKARPPIPKYAPKKPNPEDKWNFGYSHELPAVPAAAQRPPNLDKFRPAMPPPGAPQPAATPHQGSADLASQEPVNPPAPAPSWDPKMIDAGVTAPSSNLWLKVRTRYTDQRPSLIPEGGPETER